MAPRSRVPVSNSITPVAQCRGVKAIDDIPKSPAVAREQPSFRPSKYAPAKLSKWSKEIPHVIPEWV